MFSSTDCSLLIGVLVLTGTAILLAVTFCIILWIRRTKAREGEADDGTSDKPSTASPEDAAVARQPSAHMRRFLSIVERELDAGDAEPDDDAASDKSGDEKLPPSTSIVAVEVPIWTETTDQETAADKVKDAADDDDDDSDEDASRLVVIDKTRLVPEIDVETFTG